MKGIIVEWITRLLNEVPAAAQYRAQLETLAREHAELKAENARLNEELETFIPKWDTLDGDAVRTLEYLSRVERGHPREIAAANRVNIQIVESYLGFLEKWQYVRASAGGEPHFNIADKGRRYLRERGL
jgi:hypothetical protein